MPPSNREGPHACIARPFDGTSDRGAAQRPLCSPAIYHGDATVHGFRRTASTILHEKGYPPDWIELALDHKVGGIRDVYNGAANLEQRREMLTWWAEYLEGCWKVGALVG